jgi:hypothetical protein
MEYLITDLSGRILMNNVEWKMNNSINVSHLPAGVYLIKINTDKGTLTERFIKK